MYWGCVGSGGHYWSLQGGFGCFDGILQPEGGLYHVILNLAAVVCQIFIKTDVMKHHVDTSRKFWFFLKSNELWLALIFAKISGYFFMSVLRSIPVSIVCKGVILKLKCKTPALYILQKCFDDVPQFCHEGNPPLLR